MTTISSQQTVCIAVLPFENLSPESGHDYFSRGFVEDIITDLAHFANLQVISSYTSRKIGAAARDAVAVAREFQIDYLLQGNLRLKGEQIRTTAQLLDTSDSRLLWADRYDAPMDTVFDIQDNIVERVVGAISTQIDRTLLAAARKKPMTSLAAYDCWLRGMDLLREGTPAADAEARKIFKQAMAIDPNYSRAYAGMSLAYFNDWSCQLWGQWETTEKNAYRYAMDACRLDDADHIVQAILGRILLYRRHYDQAEQHLDKSLELNSNDADVLAQIATSKTFLGKARQGEDLYVKALRLNPYRNIWYHTYGALTYFAQQQYDRCIKTALKGPLTEVWVDLPAFVAAANAYTDDLPQAEHYLDVFIDLFQGKITSGRRPNPREIVDWLSLANPFKHDKDIRLLIEGLALAGLYRGWSTPSAQTQPAADHIAASTRNRFKKGDGLWQVAFGEKAVQITEVKGFYDLARLLATPGEEIHCTELMGNPVTIGDQQVVIDDKARTAYQERIRQLQADIAEAEDMNDLGRLQHLNSELEQITDHLSSALGLGKRSRPLNDPAERARSAVTWRIRNAIRKIDAVHDELGRHLAHSIRTGQFCCYSPETAHEWETDL